MKKKKHPQTSYSQLPSKSSQIRQYIYPASNSISKTLDSPDSRVPFRTQQQQSSPPPHGHKYPYPSALKRAIQRDRAHRYTRACSSETRAKKENSRETTRRGHGIYGSRARAYKRSLPGKIRCPRVCRERERVRKRNIDGARALGIPPASRERRNTRGAGQCVVVYSSRGEGWMYMCVWCDGDSSTLGGIFFVFGWLWRNWLYGFIEI